MVVPMPAFESSNSAIEWMRYVADWIAPRMICSASFCRSVS